MSAQITRLIPTASEVTRYGYARVMTNDTNDQIQTEAIRSAGVEDDCIFVDTNDYGDTVAYAHVLRILEPGDILVIPSIDRLGSTYEEIITQWELLTKVKQIRMVVLDIPLLDGHNSGYDVPPEFVSDLVLQFLFFASRRERESIRRRQHEGILAAQRRGVRFGRPPKPIPPQFETLLGQWKNKEISSRKAAQQLGVAQETFLRWSRKRESENA